MFTDLNSEYFTVISKKKKKIVGAKLMIESSAQNDTMNSESKVLSFNINT